MAALIYMIVGAFLVLFLGVPALFVALSFDADRSRRLNGLPGTSNLAAPPANEFAAEKAAA